MYSRMEEMHNGVEKIIEEYGCSKRLRIYRRTDEGFEQVMPENIQIPEDIIELLGKYLNVHYIKRYGSFTLPITKSYEESQSVYAKRMNLLSKIYGLDTDNPREVLQVLIAVEIIRLDFIGSARKDHPNWGVPHDWVIVDLEDENQMKLLGKYL